MKLLHDKTFQLNVDPEYVDSQLQDFKDKLVLIKAEEYDISSGMSCNSKVHIYSIKNFVNVHFITVESIACNLAWSYFGKFKEL